MTISPFNHRFMQEEIERLSLSADSQLSPSIDTDSFGDERYQVRHLNTPRAIAEMGTVMENALVHWIQKVHEGYSSLFAVYERAASTGDVPVANVEVNPRNGTVRQAFGPANTSLSPELSTWIVDHISKPLTPRRGRSV